MRALSTRAKEAVAISAAVVLVALALVAGGRADASNAPTPARAGAPQTVVAVAADPTTAAAQWRATPMVSVPGEVVVMPSASAPGCPVEVSEAARAAGAVSTVARCSAQYPADDASRTETFLRAVQRARETGGTVVLLGAGWAGYLPLPVPVEKLGDPGAVSLALKDAAVAGAIPDMSGISIMLAVPDGGPAMKRAWTEYTSQARAASFQWLPS